MENIKKIEDMSLNAWPSHKMELYDGWILRFSYFYTHRTNSVEQFGTSTLSWREKVAFCEKEYARLGSPAIFKISPLVSPDFDYVLENRGYEVQHTTNVMAVDLEEAALSASYDRVTLTDDIPDIWIESLFDLKGTINPVHRAVVPSMYHAIVKDTICKDVLLKISFSRFHCSGSDDCAFTASAREPSTLYSRTPSPCRMTLRPRLSYGS